MQSAVTKLDAYFRLMRMDKPIGTFLLLWPTLWAVWIAANGQPSLKIIFIFVAGVVVMRAAGCVINDFADRKIDGDVKRTAHRPIVSGEVSPTQAMLLFIGLCLIALLLVLQLNRQTFWLSFGAVALAASYPFTKRITNLPQVVLGAAFSWGIPMAFMATNGQISQVAWWLFAANLIWTVAYDTQYAMVDRDDDLRIGVKSTAILFGQQDIAIISLLQLLTVAALLRVGMGLGFNWPYYAGLAIACSLFIYQYQLIRYRQRDNCFKAFLNNHYVGLAIAIGLATQYLV
ncbi:4-hydroxybenzoate octaprenyltransferase [Neptunicella sp. SCSIO 80796]|uniref:4-hydroxybenzoate octaprenyltransferase n=1 Tax=Neptunicella plasticusilytica TaxID=3117012 RepID=UPI003A4D8A4C